MKGERTKKERTKGKWTKRCVGRLLNMDRTDGLEGFAHVRMCGWMTYFSFKKDSNTLHNSSLSITPFFFSNSAPTTIKPLCS